MTNEDEVHELTGKLWSRTKKGRENLLHFYFWGYKDGGGGKWGLGNARSRSPLTEGYDLASYLDDGEAYVRINFTGQYIEGDVHATKINSIVKLTDEEKKEYFDKKDESKQREYTSPPVALSYAGSWGPRLSIPTAKDHDEVESFDVTAFAKQISQLTSASHIMVNVTQPAHGHVFSGPNPELADVFKELPKSPFPERDLLGEVLDAIAEAGKKALVYFAAAGFHTNGVKKARVMWDEYVDSLGMSNVEATAKFLVGYYAKKYGNKIGGWWFDGASILENPGRILWRKSIHEGNPEAIIAFNCMAGSFKCKAQCDYFGGHPNPKSHVPFWDMENLSMIEAAESGPWLDSGGQPVDNPGWGALAHVFMGMQRTWNKGKLGFPPEQAIEWTSRVVSAGGMYTWHVPREGSELRGGQFELLLQIDAAIKSLKEKKPSYNFVLDDSSSDESN